MLRRFTGVLAVVIVLYAGFALGRALASPSVTPALLSHVKE